MTVLIDARFKASLMGSVLLLHLSNTFKVQFLLGGCLFLCCFSKCLASLFKLIRFCVFCINSEAKEVKGGSSYRLVHDLVGLGLGRMLL